MNDFDLNDLDPEEIIELAGMLEEEMSKEASNDEIDLNELNPEQIIELAGMLEEEMSKEASEEGIDLNDLSVDEFIELGYALNDEMEKEAAGTMGNMPAALMHMLKQRAASAGRGAMDVASAGRLRRAAGGAYKAHKDMKLHSRRSSKGARIAEREAKARRLANLKGVARGTAETGSMFAGGGGLAEMLRRRMMKKKNQRG